MIYDISNPATLRRTNVLDWFVDLGKLFNRLSPHSSLVYLIVHSQNTGVCVCVCVCVCVRVSVVSLPSNAKVVNLKSHPKAPC